MSIEFIQYLRPDGRPRSVTIDRPVPVERKAREIQGRGCRFEIEVLTTGEVSMSIFDIEEEEDVAGKIVSNDEKIKGAVDRMIEDYYSDNLENLS